MATPNAIKKFLGGTITVSLYSRDLMDEVASHDWSDFNHLRLYLVTEHGTVLADTNNWQDNQAEKAILVDLLDPSKEPSQALDPDKVDEVIEIDMSDEQGRHDFVQVYLLLKKARDTPSIPECVVDIIHMADKSVIGLKVYSRNVEQLTKAFEFDLMFDFDYNRAHVFKAGDLKDQLDCSDMSYFHKDPLGKYVLWIINNFHPDTRVFFEAL